MLEGIIPVLTLIIGYVGRIVTEWFTEERREDRDRNRRYRDWQRETLLELQEDLYKVSKGETKAFWNATRAFLETGKWPGGFLPDEDNQELHQANVRVGILATRVDDDKVRNTVEKLKDVSTTAMFSLEKGEAEAAYYAHTLLEDQLNKRIGRDPALAALTSRRQLHYPPIGACHTFRHIGPHAHLVGRDDGLGAADVFG
jgi:hypothetical protein